MIVVLTVATYLLYMFFDEGSQVSQFNEITIACHILSKRYFANYGHIELFVLSSTHALKSSSLTWQCAYCYNYSLGTLNKAY